MITMEEMLMLLGDKDVLLYEKEKQIKALKEEINSLGKTIEELVRKK